MARLRVRAWLGLALLAFLAFGFTVVAGWAASGKNIYHGCATAHQTLDRSYLDQHYREFGQLFPMRNKCNADYDLIPGWINPALVVFAVVTVVCLIGAVAATVRLIQDFRSFGPRRRENDQQ